MAEEWIEGKRQLGCFYHKLMRFKRPSGNTQIDVFVMPKIKHERPVAITIGWYPRVGRSDKVKVSIDDPRNVQGLFELLKEKAAALGCPPEVVSEISPEVERLLSVDADEITNALHAE